MSNCLKLASKDDVKELQKIADARIPLDVETVQSPRSLGRIYLDKVLVAYDGKGEPYVYLEESVSPGYYNDWRKTPGRRFVRDCMKNNEGTCKIIRYEAGGQRKKALIHASDPDDLSADDRFGFGNLVLGEASYDILKIMEDGQGWNARQDLNKEAAYVSIAADVPSAPLPQQPEEANADPQNQNVEELF